MQLPHRILFVGAHCDDIELLAGGVLTRACSAPGSRVGVLVFSDHRGVVSDELARQAREEFRANLRWLESETGASIEDHTDAILPACRGAFESERGSLYVAMERLRDRYDVVVTHSAADTNQDHRQVAEEAARVFKAHASLLAGEFPTSDLGSVAAQVYVELSPRELDAKVRMIGGYKSQQFGGRPYFDEAVIRALATLRGSQVRATAAEAFSISGRAIVRLPQPPHREPI